MEAPKKTKEDMIGEDKERYLRWQDFRIAQFTFALNLFLSFSVAALGFCFALIKDHDFVPSSGMGHLLRRSVFGLAIATVLGSLAVLTRLWDMRCTAIKIQKKYTGFRQSVAEFLAEYLGGVSWSLFYLQLAALAYGAFCLIHVLINTYSDKFAR